MSGRRARGARLDDERWEVVRRLSGGRTGTFLSRLVDVLSEAAQYAGDRDPIEWLREAVGMRVAMSPSVQDVLSPRATIGQPVDRKRFSLHERAKYDPTGTTAEIATAWAKAEGDRAKVYQYLDIDGAQWQKTLRALPKLHGQLLQICPAVRS